MKAKIQIKSIIEQCNDAISLIEHCLHDPQSNLTPIKAVIWKGCLITAFRDLGEAMGLLRNESEFLNQIQAKIIQGESLAYHFAHHRNLLSHYYIFQRFQSNETIFSEAVNFFNEHKSKLIKELTAIYNNPDVKKGATIQKDFNTYVKEDNYDYNYIDYLIIIRSEINLIELILQNKEININDILVYDESMRKIALSSALQAKIEQDPYLIGALEFHAVNALMMFEKLFKLIKTKGNDYAKLFFEKHKEQLNLITHDNIKLAIFIKSPAKERIGFSHKLGSWVPRNTLQEDPEILLLLYEFKNQYLNDVLIYLKNNDIISVMEQTALAIEDKIKHDVSQASLNNNNNSNITLTSTASNTVNNNQSKEYSQEDDLENRKVQQAEQKIIKRNIEHTFFKSSDEERIPQETGVDQEADTNEIEKSGNKKPKTNNPENRNS